MSQTFQSNSAENATATSYMTLNSAPYGTNSVTSQVYNVPPPNTYIPPYINYTDNSAAVLTTNHHMNFLVPPYPPPDFQNNPFPLTNNDPVLQHKQDGDISKSFSFEMQFSCIPQREAFVSIPNLGESNNSILFKKNEVSSDVLWVESWLSKKNEGKPKIIPEKLIKLCEAKVCFKKCIKSLQELEKLKEKMLTSYQVMNVQSWNSLCKTFLDMKNDVSNEFLKLPDIRNLQKALKKRQKKRRSQLRRNKRRKEVKTTNSENRHILHHKIDTWLKVMQGTIDCNKREESLKKEADSVLSEVLRKKADGRRQLALIEALLQLRQLRAKSAANQGQHVPPEVGVCFEKVAENLKALWSKQLQEYNVEEQGMRVMLNEAVDERDQSQVSRERQILAKWDKLLFGTRPCDFPEFYKAAEKSVETFINIRQTWDKLTVSTKASVQSNIPVGWILPSNPSSSKWESLLSPEKPET